MATVSFYADNCSYTAHASFSVSPDPYPYGIPCPKYNVANITGTIIIYANEVYCNDGYGLPADVYVNGTKVDYLQSTSVRITATDGMTIRVVPTKTGGQTYETGSVIIDRGTGVAGYGFTKQLNGSSVKGESTSNTRQTIAADVGSDIEITSFVYPYGYSSPVKVTEYTDSGRTTVKKYWYWPTDKYIRVQSGIRYIGLEASLATVTLTYATGGSGVSGMPANQTVEYGTYITITNTKPTRAGYKFLGWSDNAAAVVPNYYGGAGLTMYADLTLYAIWEKNAIEKFYWAGSDTADASLIATGQPVSNITAVRWNSLLAKIKELADAVGVSFSYTTVSKGDPITAARFNVAVRGLASIKAQMGETIRLPDEQSSGNTMYAHLFNSSVSLKYALNDMIETYNSEYR